MKKGYIIFIVGIVLVIPILLNFIIPLPALFPVIGEPVNWLMFWATYLSAAASFGMIVYTALTLDEMKRQWNEEHKKELVAYLVVHNNYFYLCIKNTSIVPIINIRASITHVPSGVHKPYAEFLKNFNNSVFSIEAGGCRYINTYIVNSCPAGYSTNAEDYDADDYLGITLAFDKDTDKGVSFNLPFCLGKILKDELEDNHNKHYD